MGKPDGRRAGNAGPFHRIMKPCARSERLCLLQAVEIIGNGDIARVLGILVDRLGNDAAVGLIGDETDPDAGRADRCRGPTVPGPGRRSHGGRSKTVMCTRRDDGARRDAAETGDQPTRCTPRGTSTVPLGSKSRHHPDCPRTGDVRRSTSGFVDVVSTAPRAASTFGTTNDEVLPDLDGPRTSVERSLPDHAHPRVDAPRTIPDMWWRAQVGERGGGAASFATRRSRHAHA